MSPSRPRDIPPMWLCLAFAAEVGLHFGAPLAHWLRWPWTAAGIAVNVLGLLLMAMSAGLFRRVGTGVRPFTEATTLVASGPYRWTRNPMYLGMVVMLVGAALSLGTPGPWLAAAALAVTLDLRFIRNEERALAVSLGEPYERYRERVRRWL